MPDTTRRPRLSFEAIGRLAELGDYSAAFALRAVCSLGVADRMAEGGRSLADLATATGSHAPSLLRVLRALVAKGIFVEPVPLTFGLTPVGDLLRSDHPLSMGDAFRLHPDVEALAEMTHTLRTGRAAFEELHGEGYFDYLSSRPELREEFLGSQRALTRLELLALVRAYDWSGLRRVVDVGGNDGTFLARLLTRYPGMCGVVFDLPETVAAAQKVLAEAGVADRCETVAGDFFETPLPRAGDAYVAKRVVVGLDDAEVDSLLRSVRAAMTEAGRLLIIEPMHTPEDNLASSMDLLMLVLGDGRVRAPAEMALLLDKGGFEMTRVLSVGLSTIVEARPC